MKRTGTILALLPILLGSCDQMIDQQKAALYSSDSRMVQQDPDAVAWKDTPSTPPSLTLALLQRGQQRYRIDCVPCHSELGDGNGMVVQRGFPHPPSYDLDRLRQAPTQHFYDVMTDGYGDMYSFAGRLSPQDRWAVAAYIRALQLSRHADLASLSDAERKALP
jgi:mono/diheme cytochrome c family protein